MLEYGPIGPNGIKILLCLLLLYVEACALPFQLSVDQSFTLSHGIRANNFPLGSLGFMGASINQFLLAAAAIAPAILLSLLLWHLLSTVLPLLPLCLQLLSSLLHFLFRHVVLSSSPSASLVSAAPFSWRVLFLHYCLMASPFPTMGLSTITLSNAVSINSTSCEAIPSDLYYYSPTGSSRLLAAT